ncbi:MAG: TldD/PmbA family protein [Thermodesulfovibrionales bacterium]|nr:TldD/PmbA family protein [Thermodesulfovibrionales bacterium]
MKEDFLNKVIDDAIRAGAHEAEVYLQANKGLSVEVKELEAESIETFNTSGYGIRIIKDGKVGFSYSTNLNNYRDVIKSAIASSKYVTIQDFNKLPRMSQTVPNKDISIYDEKISSINTDMALEKVLSMERAALKEKFISKIRKAEGSFITSDVFIKNSSGIDNSYKSSYASAHILLSAERDGDMETGWDFQANRFIDAINFEEIGMTAARRATAMLGAKKISSLKGFVVIDSISAINFLSLLSSSFTAESVQKGRSILKGKIGQKVFTDKVDIIDNAHINGLIGSRPFDAEGVPTRETKIVEKGYLKGFLYNSFTAAKDGIASTGNAVRSSYTTVPSVGMNNLYLTASQGTIVVSQEEIIKAVDKGVYITEILGMHTANPITGEFSVGVSGLWIENGALKYPFKEAMVTGNIFELLNNIALIGDDIKFYGNIGSPTLLIESIDISA